MVPQLTNNGISLMVRAMGGEGITFSKIAIGNGENPGEHSELTTLQNELVSMDIEKLVSEEQYVIIKASMSNADFEAGFYWTELGVYAKDPDGGDDVLYAYAHYAISGDEAPTYIPASSSSLVEITHSVHVFVGELENVTALLTKHAEFATAANLAAHVENTDNPHKVTKAQVGLGLIVNARPEDQRPRFSTVVSPYVVNEKTNKYTFSNIFSGERVGSILQKLRTMITLVIQHFNAINPHNVTAAQAGAAAKTHFHSVSDLTSGTLGLGRGGTGATSATQARTNLGIQCGSGEITVAAGKVSVANIVFPVAYEGMPKVIVMPCITNLASCDLRISTLNVEFRDFEVEAYSETLDMTVPFHWIACL